MGRAFEFRKERKFKRWAAMAKTFTRIGREIAMSIKSGGSNPESNVRLRIAIQNAKGANMPKINVDNAIKKATEKGNAAYEEITYEGHAAFGVAIIVDCATDNTNRTVANLRTSFNKCGGELGTHNSVKFLFEPKSVFKVKNNNYVLEDLELALIDFGLEELELDINEIILISSFQNYGNMYNALEQLSTEIISSDIQRFATTYKTIKAEQEEQIMKLIERLDEDDDVVNIYHNYKIEH